MDPTLESVLIWTIVSAAVVFVGRRVAAKIWPGRQAAGQCGGCGGCAQTGKKAPVASGVIFLEASALQRVTKKKVLSGRSTP